MHRFYLKNILFNNSGLITISDRRILHQAKNVLRFKKGDEFILFNESGFDYKIKVKEIGAEIEGLLILKTEAENEPAKNINLFFAFIKPKNIELILQKAVEIGAASFTPIITERTLKKEVSDEKSLRWNTIITEAVEQCGGMRIPKLKKTEYFSDLTANFKNLSGTNFIFDKSGKKINSFNRAENCKEINIFIGPEGGFTEQEIKKAESLGFEVLSFGKRTFRAETAAITAVFFFAEF